MNDQNCKVLWSSIVLNKKLNDQQNWICLNFENIEVRMVWHTTNKRARQLKAQKLGKEDQQLQP